MKMEMTVIRLEDAAFLQEICWEREDIPVLLGLKTWPPAASPEALYAAFHAWERRSRGRCWVLRQAGEPSGIAAVYPGDACTMDCICRFLPSVGGEEIREAFLLLLARMKAEGTCYLTARVRRDDVCGLSIWMRYRPHLEEDLGYVKPTIDLRAV